MTVKKRLYWKFIKQILFLLNYILFIIKICQLCKIKSHWMFSVVFFMFYICVICDCVCVLKYAIYLIWPRQFSFGPDSSHLAHVFLIWLIPWPEQKMSQRGPWNLFKTDQRTWGNNIVFLPKEAAIILTSSLRFSATCCLILFSKKTFSRTRLTL